MGEPAGEREGSARRSLDETGAREARPSVATESVSEAELAAGRELEEAFELGDALGAGGMGAVVEAKDPRLGRWVAVKVMHADALQNPTLRRRFVIEAQVTAQLEHPHIVPVYGMEQRGGAPAFAMRRLQGRDLAHLIARRRAAVEAGGADEGDGGLRDRLEIFLRVCEATAYANARGVIHRDLKPENVMLGAHREVYVVDWGVAKVLGEPEVARGEAPVDEAPAVASEDELGAERRRDSSGDPIRVSTSAGTRHGQAIGSLMYMPPEQMEGDVELHSSASDQFALGMMLQELVTLETPRRDTTTVALMAAALDARRREPIGRDGRRAPAALAAIIARATQKAPADRYPSIDALADDVRRQLLGEPVSVHPEGLARRLWRRLSKRPGMTLAVVMLLLLAGATVSLLSVRRTLAAERRAAEESARLQRLSAAVRTQSQQVNEQLARIRTLVEGLGAATEELLRRPSATTAHRYGAAGWLAGRGPGFERLEEHERYGMAVTMDQSLYIYAEGSDEAAMEALMVQLDPLHERLRETFLRSAGPGPFSDARMRQLFWEERPPVHMSYVAFESGLMLTFPGYEPFPEGYDHRRRPWYVGASSERRGPTFGAPYPDASNSAVLVPCNRPLHAPDGAFIGVAGADMAMDDVIAALPVEVEGWTRGGLADGAGTLIVDTENERLRLGFGLHGDEAFEGSALDPAIAEAIAGASSGWIRLGEQWVFFDRLAAIDWTLLAWIRR